jgi:hypothetical protein
MRFQTAAKIAAGAIVLAFILYNWRVVVFLLAVVAGYVWYLITGLSP